MGNFVDLKVWQLAKDLSIRVYQFTREGLISKDLGLCRQMQRSAVSIASNIAEGDESGSNRMAIKYFHLAKGSAAELMTQVIIANEIGYLKEESTEELISFCKSIGAILNRLIQIRKS
jgi:four helix bundle protein